MNNNLLTNLKSHVSSSNKNGLSGKVSNIEYGNIEKWEHRKMLSSKTVTSNLTSKMVTSTVIRGQTGGQMGQAIHEILR